MTFDLPVGVAVRVDGVEYAGGRPATKVALSAGSHQVGITLPCTTNASFDEPTVHTSEVVVKAGATTRVDTGTAGLRDPAVLRVRVITPRGLVTGAQLKVGDAPFQANADVKVYACRQRLQISAQGWGGFMEDIDFEPGKKVVRDIELAKGPDLVRIHGAEFTLGPPAYWGEEGDDFFDYGWISRRRVTVRTFDLDKTEVTASQFHECQLDGACKIDRMLWPVTRKPPSAQWDLCTNELYGKNRPVVPGRGNFPANCVARWEAEQYCTWVGKRLPGAAEWEFAARSRDETYSCPWPSHPDDLCRDHGKRGEELSDVCSIPGAQSDQGVCDLMTGLSEYVNGPAGGEERGRTYDGRMFSVTFETDEDGPRQRFSQSISSGFRCARNVFTGAEAR